MQDFLEGQFDKKFYLPPKGVAFVTKNKNLKKRYTQVNGKLLYVKKEINNSIGMVILFK